MSSPTEAALAEYYTDNTIPWTANPGIIVASIIVSFLGSYATLMLLGRRTAEKGAWNLTWLVLSALSFSVVGIWSMHFVSMLGLRLLPSSSTTWYIRFSAGFTALSLFVPLICCCLAFIFLGSQAELVVWRICLTGCFVGCTISLMHYSALFHLATFDVHYKGYVVFLATLEACIAASLALLLFFKYRALWQDNILKRIGCACILAAAVCGMHYIGLAGTSWTYKPGTPIEALDGAKSQSTRLTIAISVMCLVIIASAIALAIIDLIRRRKTVREARQIVVCSAAFDKFGRVLVKIDGTLPMMLIETEAYVKDIVDELNPKEPTFQWLFRLSFNWSIITSFHSLIAESIAARRAGKSTKRPSPEPKGVYGRNGSRAAAARAHAKKTAELRLFRQRFVEAAYELSAQMDVPMEDLGTLFDRVLTTGTLGAPAPLVEKGVEGRASEDVEATAGTGVAGAKPTRGEAGNQEGVMLVVVRELTDQRQLDQYLLGGYRLAETKHFSHVFASRVGVPKPDMDEFLLGCKTFSKRGTRPVVQASGVYVGLFGVTPTLGPHGKEVDVLTYGFSRHQIPAYRLPDLIAPLTSETRNWLRSIAGLTMSDVLTRIDNDIASPKPRRQNNRSSSRPSSRGSMQSNRWSDDDDDDESSDPLLDFQIALSIAIEALSNSMVGPWPNISEIARLSPEILSVPPADDNSAHPAQVIVLSALLPDLAPPPLSRPTSSFLQQTLRETGPMSPTGVGGEKTGSPSPYSDHVARPRPPAPFVFTPLSLFSAAQTMLIRGRGAEDFAKEVVQQLAHDYGSIPPSVTSNPTAQTSSIPFPPSPSSSSLHKNPSASPSLDLASHPSRLTYASDATAPSLATHQHHPSNALDDLGRIAGQPHPSFSSSEHLSASASKSSLIHQHKKIPSFTGTKKPTIPQRSASLQGGRRGSESSAEGGGGGGERHPLPTIGRFAIGGSDGWEKRVMKDVELSADGRQLAGVDW